MDEKIYTQEIVSTTPFPGQIAQFDSQAETGTGDTFTPNVSKDKSFPVKRTAVELLSTSLNTRSKRILQEFQLQQSGGLKVGDFQEGLSGDIRITPDGIVARDIAGLITFFIDALTGDASFKGILQAGTLIAGDSNVVIDEGSSGGRIVLYNNGIPEILIGDST